MLAWNSSYYCVIIPAIILKITVLQLAIFSSFSSQKQQFVLNTTTPPPPTIFPSQHLIILPLKFWDTWHKFWASLLQHVTIPHHSTMHLSANKNWFICPNVKSQLCMFYRYLKCLFNFNFTWIHSFLTSALNGRNW